MDKTERKGMRTKIEELENEINNLKSELKIRRELEEQLLQAQKMEALAALSGGIAHDFNNILHCILGYTELALMDKSKSVSDDDSFKEIQSMVKKGKELTKQLLEFGRKIDAQFSPLDLNIVIENVEKILRRTIPRMIDIELRLADNLKNIGADAGQCEQILMNLCLNAKDSMPEGGKLTLSTDNMHLDGKPGQSYFDPLPGDYVRLTVTDTGRGMPSKTLKHMYEPFFTTKERGKGTGLGLSMVYAIVKNHGGFIECKSTPGEGTMFRIYLPVMNVAEEPSRSSSPQPATGSVAGNEVVLMIDDETDIIKISRKLLQENGYTVITANNGEEGIALFLQNGVDLVLLDVSMPGIGGVECLKEILAINPEAKVIIVSGYLPDSWVEKTLKLGAKAFLPKPCTTKELLSTVRELLDE